MLNILADLKNNYNIKGIKASFEDEGLGFDDVLKLKKISDECSLDFSIKIGGSGSIGDIKIAKKIGAKILIAPMIETSYALQKFIKSVQVVYEECEIELLNLYINIETKTGFANLKDILSLDEVKYLKGIVLGRSDMANSFRIEKENINNNFILDISYDVSKLAKEKGLEFIIGGGIFKESIPFLSKLEDNLDFFETRKIIFSKSALNNKDIEKGIIKALEFEVMWLKNLSNITKKEKERLKTLENSIKKMPANI